MPEHSSDTVVPADGVVAADERPARRSRRIRRTDWRLGGRSVLHWREGLLAIALLCLGAGILGGYGALRLGLPSWAATAIVWAAMVVAIVLAFARSRPVGVLRFRVVDLLWAVSLGLIVRLVDGWVSGAGGVTAPFPSLPTVDGHLATGWWFDGVLAPVVFAPPIEELFFRAVLLIALFTVLRRPFGGFAAGLTSLLVTTGLFIVAHSLEGAPSVAAIVSVAVLGAVCGSLVLLTGRIWGAIGVHIVFNALGVALAVLGAL